MDKQKRDQLIRYLEFAMVQKMRGKCARGDIWRRRCEPVKNACARDRILVGACASAPPRTPVQINPTPARGA